MATSLLANKHAFKIILKLYENHFPFYSTDIYHASSSALAPLSVTIVLGLVLRFSGLVTALTLSIIVLVLILVL